MTEVNVLDIVPEKLTCSAFAPFGDVVSDEVGKGDLMNGRTYDRFLDLAQIDIGSDDHRVQVNIVECNTPDASPYHLKLMERHPESSQLFYPLFDHDYFVAVAPAGDTVTAEGIRLFRASSGQGVNYHRGTWHMPMVGICAGDRFLMVERDNMHSNCDLFEFINFSVRIELPQG